MLVVSHNDLLISLLQKILNNKGVTFEIIKKSISLEQLQFINLQTNNLATVIDLQVVEHEESEKKWIDFLKTSKKPIMLVNTKHQNIEHWLDLQRAIFYLYHPLISFGNIFSQSHIKQDNSLDKENQYLNIHLNNEVIFSISDLCVIKKGEKIPLTNLEAKILLFLYKNLNEVIETDMLLQKAELSNSTSLYVHINNIRKKIEEDPKNPIILRTQRGKGYMLCVQP